MVDVRCQCLALASTTLASLVQTDGALAASSSCMRAESCLLWDCVEGVGQSGSHTCLLHMIHMRMSGLEPVIADSAYSSG